MADGARMQAQPKQPPHSIEAEQSVLGGLMLDNRAFDAVAEVLGAEDFYRQDHQLIFGAIAKLHQFNRPFDFVTLSEAMRARGKLEEAGGLAYLGSLANDTPSAANVLTYARLVRERAVLRELIAVGGDIAELGYHPDGREQVELLDLASQRVFQLTQKNEPAVDYSGLDQLVTEVEADIEKAHSVPGSGLGLSTGIMQLDDMTTGLHPGDVWVVAGRSSMGKTAFALNIAENLALYEKVPIAVFSMEMPKRQIAMRIVSSYSRVSIQAMRKGTMNDRDFDRLTAANKIVAAAPIFVDDTGGLTPNQLRARARRMKKRHNIGLLVIDYIQLMQCPGSENRTNEIGEISRSIKRLAKELDIPIIALAQLNRGADNRENKRPRLADLRESGSIEQDADAVLFLYRDEVFNENSPDKGTAEIIIGKQRNGPIGTVRAAYLGDYTRFENLADGWQPAETKTEKPTRGLGRKTAAPVPPPVQYADH
jgi:replicative DNA helicase